MEYKKYLAIYNGKKFVIEEDNPDVGYYLYVYENDKCVKDYLQNSLAIAKECAYEDYSVPINIWKEMNNETKY